MVKCLIQGKEVEALWDTGSQVCVVSRKWQQAHLPLGVLRNVEEFLGVGEDLNLEAMNGTDIPFEGWIEVKFKLAGDYTTADELTVPVLLKRKEQEYPNIGFNVKKKSSVNTVKIPKLQVTSFSSHSLQFTTPMLVLWSILSSQDHRMLVLQLSKSEREMLCCQKERQRKFSVKFTSGLFQRECR